MRDARSPVYGSNPMPISGLLITLDCDPSKRAEALAALRQHPAIDIGEGEAHRVPIVVDTPSSDEDRAVWDWLHDQPGVAFVDLVYVHFDVEDEQRQRGAKDSPSIEGGGIAKLDIQLPPMTQGVNHDHH
jgi:nitrate reductase NapAB chaperone NapD